jgi:hypothetical protein
MASQHSAHSKPAAPQLFFLDLSLLINTRTIVDASHQRCTCDALITSEMYREHAALFQRIQRNTAAVATRGGAAFHRTRTGLRVAIHFFALISIGSIQLDRKHNTAVSNASAS